MNELRDELESQRHVKAVELLKDFYKVMYSWVSFGVRPKDEYGDAILLDSRLGLCGNLYTYAEATGRKYLGDIAHQAMTTQFTAAGLCPIYPFEERGDKDKMYQVEQNNGTVYHNPNRVKWIKEHAEK